MRIIFFSCLLLFSSLIMAREFTVHYSTDLETSLSQQHWSTYSSSDSINWKSDYYIRVDIQQGEAGNFVLKGGNWYMEAMTFYTGEMAVLKTGNHLSVDLNSSDTTFIIYYPFVDQKSRKAFNVQLLDQIIFLKSQESKNVLQSIFQSITLFLFIVSLVFGISSRDRVYYYYALYLLTLIYFFAYQYGILSILLPFVRNIPPALIWISSASLTVAYVFFAIHFLNLRENGIFAYKVLKFGLYYIACIVLIETISYWFDYDVQHQAYYKVTVLIIQFPMMLMYLYGVYKMKNILSTIFLIGAIVLMVASLCAQFLSTFYRVEETNLFIQGGLLLDVFIFAVGIGIRVRLINKEKAAVQNDLIEQLQINKRLQQAYTQELESKVQKRTLELEKKNLENETLLKEIHHRVKNNLQMISSLLNIQMRRMKDVTIKGVLSETKTRIRSVGLIHEHLYSHDNLSKIALKDYIEDLVHMLEKTLFTGEGLQLQFKVIDRHVDFDVAISIGLILNELVTNSMKYAFNGHLSPELSICLTETNEGTKLIVHDNGPGFSGTPSGFGWSIIHSTLDNLDYSVVHENSNGFKVTITIIDDILA